MEISRRGEQPTVLDSFTQKLQGGRTREALHGKFIIKQINTSILWNGAYAVLHLDWTNYYNVLVHTVTAKWCST